MIEGDNSPTHCAQIHVVDNCVFGQTTVEICSGNNTFVGLMNGMFWQIDQISLYLRELHFTSFTRK